MTQVLFIQGGGAETHDLWDDKLVASLRAELGPGYTIRYPRMPNEADPELAAWTATLRQELSTIGDGAVLVGHSVGGTVLLHALASRSAPPPLRAIVVLAAPFIGDGGWPSAEVPSPPEFTTTLPRDVPLVVVHGLDDATVPPAHATLYAQAIPWARVQLLPGRDHQFNDDLTEVAALIRAVETPA